MTGLLIQTPYWESEMSYYQRQQPEFYGSILTGDMPLTLNERQVLYDMKRGKPRFYQVKLLKREKR